MTNETEQSNSDNINKGIEFEKGVPLPKSKWIGRRQRWGWLTEEDKAKVRAMEVGDSIVVRGTKKEMEGKAMAIRNLSYGLRKWQQQSGDGYIRLWRVA